MTAWSPPDAALAARLVDRFGEGARGWLEGLPSVVEALAARWSLTPVMGAPVGGGGTSLVVRCGVGNGAFEGVAVLKLTPDPALAVAEADALAAWAGTGAVPSVLARDDGVGALLMEAIGDGTTVGRALPDPARIGALLGRLHSVPADAIDAPPLAERVAFVFDLWERRRSASAAARARVPREAMARGRAQAEALARDTGAARVLLHGDLHPGNVIDGGPAGGLVAIDPRACIGEPAFDAIDWVLSGEPDEGQTAQRITALVPFAGGSADRLHAWCSAFAPMIEASRAIRTG